MYMLNFEKGLRVLALAPHPDDIELGCGATLLWLRKMKNAEVFYRVFSTGPVNELYNIHQFTREIESKNAAEMFGIDTGSKSEIDDALYYDSRNFTDGHFPEHRAQIHYYLELTKRQIDPHIVIAPSLNDMHQDHVTVAEAVLRIFREGQAIWHYEILQFERGRFVPNLFTVGAKCTYKFVKIFTSEMNQPPAPSAVPNRRDSLGGDKQSDDVFAHGAR